MGEQSKNKPSPTWLFNVDTVERWAYWDNAFTPEECEQIINQCKAFKLKQAIIEGKDPYNKEIRESNVCWITPDTEFNWLYTRISDLVTRLNDDYFKFDLYGFTEPLQFTEYKAPTGHYDFHVDKIYNGDLRKLSIVVQLSDPEEYEGGDFELMDSNEPEKLSRKRGTMLAFPSYTLHRVTPTSKGERYSLVCWVSGPNFK
jgi:PKHD-type hydroxylase